MEPGDLQPKTSDAASDARRRRRRRMGLRLLVTIGFVLVGLAALIGLFGQESSTRFIVSRIPGLTAEGVRGPLLGGRFSADRLVWQGTPGGLAVTLDKVMIDGLHLRPLPRSSTWLALQVDALTVQRLQVRSGPPSGAPAKAPLSLAMPLELLVQRLSVGELQVDDQPPAHDLRTRLHIGAAEGREHRLDGVVATWQNTAFNGDLRIATSAPLTVQAALAARALPAGAWSAKLDAQGPLAQLPLVLALQTRSGTGELTAELDASATVSPFAAWPLDTLALRTRELDLASLIAGAPRTKLSGTATLRTSGKTEPVQAEVAITNAAAGRWDEGLLPVAQLLARASGRIDTRDQIDIAEFAVDLGAPRAPAGRWRGSGQWRGNQLSLDTRIDALRPQRLDRRAAALSASGPIALRLIGLPPPDPRAKASPSSAAVERPALRAEIDSKLEGRLDARAGVPVRLQLVAGGSLKQLEVRSLRAEAGGAVLTLDGRLDLSDTAVALRARAAAQNVDPRVWWAGAEGSAWRQGPHRLNGKLQADLSVARALLQRSPSPLVLLRSLRGNADLAVADSVLAGLPLQSSATLKSVAGGAQVSGSVDAQGNSVRIDGRLGTAADGRNDRFALDLSVPQAASLAPLFRLGPASVAAWAPRRGNITAKATFEGLGPALATDGTAAVRELQLGDANLNRADLRWRLAADDDAPLELDVTIDNLSRGPQRLERLRANATGSRRSHTLVLDASSPIRPPAWTETLLGPAGTGSVLQLRAQGQFERVAAIRPARGGGAAKVTADAWRWRAQVPLLRAGSRETAAAAPWVNASALALEARFDAVGGLTYAAAAPGRVQIPQSALRWSSASWQRNVPQRDDPQRGEGQPLIDVDAELEPIEVAALLAKLQPDFGWSGDLRVGGRAKVKSGARFDADVEIERSGGDLRITDAGAVQQLDLSALRFAVSAHDGLWQFTQALAGANFGGIAGAQVVRTSPQRLWPEAQAPLEGVLEVQVANLGSWGAWVPAGWRLSGQLRTSASFGGRFGAPEVNGTMRGSGLGARNALEGVYVSDGELAVALNGKRAEIERFVLKAGDGTLSISGGATFGAQPQLQVQAVAERFAALGRVDRRVVVSGKADVLFSPESLKVDGALGVDEGLFDFTRSDSPKVDADVVVIRDAEAPAEPVPPLPPWLRDSSMALKVNLGQALRIRGRGLNTTLQGDLQVTLPAGRPTLIGTVRTVSGTYVAYGQNLQIERGEVAFSGPPDNPRLDILATRPNLDVIVGVAVTGTAQNPRVRLTSEPEMSDYDKMSWLMLGRASEGLGRADTALLQRAALALLSGEGSSPTDNFLNQIGITDFSLRQSEDSATGDSGETVVALGRQISRRWYLGYERSVNAAAGTWQLVYRIARRLTVRAQSGDDQSLDMIWSWRW
jgi:translocation and assembly module TamB